MTKGSTQKKSKPESAKWNRRPKKNKDGFIDLALISEAAPDVVKKFFPIPVQVSTQFWEMMKERTTGDINWTLLDVLSNLKLSLKKDAKLSTKEAIRGKTISETLHRFDFRVSKERVVNVLAEIYQEPEGSVLRLYYPSEQSRLKIVGEEEE